MNCQRVAMRREGYSSYNGLYYPSFHSGRALVSDHLGSTSLVLNSSGTILQQTKYKPWGEVRSGSITLTDFGFTGQKTTSVGLMYYVARHYDPALGRFTQADTIVPGAGNPQSYDRFAYGYNNALRYVDPSGHFSEDEICNYWGYCDEDSAKEGLGLLFSLLWNTAITWGDTLLIGDENGVNIAAAFVLEYYDGEYHASLWDIDRGDRVQWGIASSAMRLAAYNEKGNVWETADANGSWGGRHDAEVWAMYKPTTHYAQDLYLSWSYVGYGLTNYEQYNPMDVASVAFGMATLPIPVAKFFALIKNALTITFLGYKVSQLKPEAIYPIVVFAPHREIGPIQYWISPP